MKKDLRTGLIAIVVMTVFLGLAYPLAITGISQVAFPGHANGSKLTFDGRVVGSKLIGQSFTDSNGNALPQYFQSRPSDAGDGYAKGAIRRARHIDPQVGKLR